jgi:uncharacterized membrane protein YjgN (DUF898 family)
VLKSSFFSVITFGLYTPFFVHNIRKFLVDRMSFGTAKFRYSGDKWAFAKLSYKGFFFTMITFGFYAPWFLAKLARFKVEHIHLENVDFRIHLKGSELLKMTILGSLGTVLSLGLATPWIVNWYNQMLISRVEVQGLLDFEKIKNITSDGDATADVAAMEFDIDIAA